MLKLLLVLFPTAAVPAELDPAADISANILPLFVDDNEDVDEMDSDDDEGGAGNLRCCCGCGNKYSISFRS